MRDIEFLKKKRQVNVQEQNSLTKHTIMQFAVDFRKSRNLPEALIKFFEENGIDTNLSILTWHDTMSFGGSTEAYRGEWLTQDKQFYSYEITLDPNDEFIDDVLQWENITDEVDLNQHSKGIGKTSGWLCIEVLNELNS